ncbi:lantibiotic dehydratase [Microbispora sp. NPDC088329]|uniref:lantibiotic dehydratase n=1 Tax=Microbispora sp. NPDC088329 TaxID=3154869 RepID=UPI003422C35C
MTSTTTAQAAGLAGEWTLNPLFVMRVGGLPADVVRGLRCPETVRWAERTLVLEDALAGSRVRVADALETVIADCRDGTRQALIELRRDVFNTRLPRDLPATRTLTAGLTQPARDEVSDWLDRRAEYERVRTAGAALLAGEVEECRAHLRSVAADPRLRHGLQLASGSLDRYLPTYLDAGPGRLGKRARRIERSLLEYVFRTACKTSPFSTLTTVALGRFDDVAGEVLRLEGLDRPARSHVRLNVAALARLTDAIVANPDRCADVPVEMTSGLRADSRRIRYVRRVRQAGDDEASLSFDSLQEDLFYLSNGTMLQELMTALKGEPRMRLGDLAAALHRADPAGRERATIDFYLKRLLQLSLLRVPQLHIDIHSDDPLADFGARIAALGQPWADAAAGRIRAISAFAAEFGLAAHARRGELIEAIRGELTAIQHDLAAEQASVPRTLLYEDVCLPEATVTAARPRWEEGMLPALRDVMRILPLFDMTLPGKLSFKGFFVARYGRGGRCSDVLRLIHEFHRDFYDHLIKAAQRRRVFDADGEYVPQDNWLRLPEITMLDDARRELVTRLRSAWEALPEGADEIVLDREFFDAVAAKLPESVAHFDPRSFFLQVGDVDGRPIGVLNRSYSGLTLLFSRFAHCFTDAGLVAELRRTLKDLQPDGAVFAELTGGYDTTNLNLHPPVTEYELVCPGETSSVDPAAQIAVADLEIYHDEAADRLVLWSPALGREVIPVYLGFLQPLALPEVQRALLLFSHTSMAPLSVWDGVDRPLGDAAIGGHPRLRHGDLVLTRRAWKVHPSRLPSRVADDAEWFLAWQRWRRENGLPRRVFAMVDAGRGEDAGEADPAATLPRKPQYVDFDSLFSLTLLDHLVKDASQRVVMQEMLPDTDHLWLRAHDGAYVAEQTLEITRHRGEPR